MDEESKGDVYTIKLKNLKWLIPIIIIVVGYLSFYIPVPYYLTMPGSALELSPIVEVENGYQEKGEFMITTVSMMQGNLPTYLFSKFDSYMDAIPEEYLLNPEEDPEDYSKRQIEVMKESQENAIITAFRFLNEPIEIENKGILVMGLVKGTPSSKILNIGDLIVEVDQKQMKEVTELLDYLKTKNKGDTVELKYIRENKEFVHHIPLINLAAYDNDEMPIEKIGLGIYPYQDREVSTDKKINFNTKRIGGPSAGFMFTLEIINQLTEEDLTKGYLIAGTGTINARGEIGQIGGARFKVKAANEKGAEIFFVPKDIESHDTNEKDAIQSNTDLGSPMEIVPVANVEDAINYLKKLPVK